MSFRRGSNYFKGRGSSRGSKGGEFGSGTHASGRYRRTRTITAGSVLATDGTSSGEEKFEALKLANEIDEKMGFSRFESGSRKVGWLINMHSVSFWNFQGERERRRRGLMAWVVDDCGG